MFKVEKTQQRCALIYKHTAKDMRSTSAQSILVGSNHGTTVSLVSDLPDKIFAEQLLYAVSKEICARRDLKLKEILQPFMLVNAVEQTNQWRDTRDDFVGYLEAYGHEKHDEIVKAIDNADIHFPNQGANAYLTFCNATKNVDRNDCFVAPRWTSMKYETGTPLQDIFADLLGHFNFSI